MKFIFSKDKYIKLSNLTVIIFCIIYIIYYSNIKAFQMIILLNKDLPLLPLQFPIPILHSVY